MSRTIPGGTAVDYAQSVATTDYDSITGGVCWWMIITPFTYVVVGGNDPRYAQVGGSNRGTYPGIFASGFLKLGCEGVGAKSGTATTGVTIGEWQALQWQSVTGGNAKFKKYLYSNTTLTTETVTSTGGINPPANPDNRMMLGNFISPAADWSGGATIDRILYMLGDPSDGEFTAWATAGTLPGSTTILGHWILSPLGPGTPASPEIDLSAFAHNLTVTGTTAAAPFTLPSGGGPVIGPLGDLISVGDTRFVPV